jgi:superfamily II DNA/RNA helicase/very-short-patch-repair endonuclease
MNVFDLRNNLINDYGKYIGSFINIRDEVIKNHVELEFNQQKLWPDPLIQLNPTFETGGGIEEHVKSGLLHKECLNIFRFNKQDYAVGHDPFSGAEPLKLYTHQLESVKISRKNQNYVLTTGTGSGKSLCYIIPIVDYILRNPSKNSIKAIIVYPMNALANSQKNELTKYLNKGYPDGKGPVTFARYTGQETKEERDEILKNPPDILLTNYVMLELLMTRFGEQELIKRAEGLKFMVLDELHMYRGRQGADVAMLVRRVRSAAKSPNMLCVGTSATLAGATDFDSQRIETAAVASKIFGAEVLPESIISETLCRITPERDEKDESFKKSLVERIDKGKAPKTYGEFIADPLSSWIESRFGIKKENGRYVRNQAVSIFGESNAAAALSELLKDIAKIDPNTCGTAIKEQFLASYTCNSPESGRPPFAFRLHQFISRGDTVYSSIGPEEDRHLTLNGQKFVPNDRNKILLPLEFCRECGQEFYCVWRTSSENDGYKYVPREFSEPALDENDVAGFLFISQERPWSDNVEDNIERLPPDWVEEHKGGLRIKKASQPRLPINVRVRPDGVEAEDGNKAAFIGTPFRFCPHCGVSYSMRARSDYGKLGTLTTEGRSSATTLLCLSTIRHVMNETSLKAHAKKLLSFTDNRQDASLQAGHFNDFVETGILRSAVYRTLMAAGKNGIKYDELAKKIFDSIGLDIKEYAVDPTVKFNKKVEVEQAFQNVIGYRVYRDLKDGWRITIPNLEYCGLLKIEYQSLRELCESDEEWQNIHPALVGASPDTRYKIAKTLLDWLRQQLAIKVDYLDPIFQSKIKMQSSQQLVEPWAIDSGEDLESSCIAFPRPTTNSMEDKDQIFISARGSFGQYLRRPETFQEYKEKISVEEAQNICVQIFKPLQVAGLVHEVYQAESDAEVSGYQLPASAMLWIIGDETRVNDPLKTPTISSEKRSFNKFFVDFYKGMAAENSGIKAKEHTAQVPALLRQEREKDFREATLPILFCSPTMELGIDIADLNVVNMRNVPPTPANYAQRSGRAGRSGQPALVFTYCSTYSSHDQYFFNRPERMVSGSVVPPKLDLTNEDLILSHIHAVWLAEASMLLGKSLKDILEVTGDPPSLNLQQSVLDRITAPDVKKRAKLKAREIIDSINHEIKTADWWSEDWIDRAIDNIQQSFDQACDRWRSLFRSASQQIERQNKISNDASRNKDEKDRARRLRAEAETQKDLLLDSSSAMESDFYSYRYLACEGFLPGYNFPRLPLSAFIPGRKQQKGRDEFLSRPRFLAISEFGPRAVVYHEGARYRINRVIIPAADAQNKDPDGAILTSIKQCAECGYVNLPTDDKCRMCGQLTGPAVNNFFRLQNVSTKRIDRIHADEEERLRMGYEIKTGVKFEERNGMPVYKVAEIMHEGKTIAKLTFGQAATIWRINLGWSRRKERNKTGFMLDLEKGYWAKNEDDATDATDDILNNTRRVVPYVEDHKNCLLFQPLFDFDEQIMASLQAALKNAIQVKYQLEDMEIAAEPLPDRKKRNMLMFFESAEGGAGVLRRIAEDKKSFSEIAAIALQICHFAIDGTDIRRNKNSDEDCEAACYNCLMNYSNQRDHDILDRQAIKEMLMQLLNSEVICSSGDKTYAEHLQELMNLTQSALERKWLELIVKNKLKLPTHAQKKIEECGSTPDFLYSDAFAAIYVDGPHHDYEKYKAIDAELNDKMADHGFTVIRFRHDEEGNWEDIIKKYPNVFGRIK